MNAPLDSKMDKATFFRWASHQEGKYELVNGRPVLQQTGTRDHQSVAKNIERALDQRLDLSVWNVGRGGLSVEEGEETRVPDVMVEPAGLEGKAMATDQAVLLVEVLSPSSSSVYNDMSAKPSLYFQLASLEVYIVASQDIPCLWVWQRSQDRDRAFPDQPQIVEGLDASVALQHLAVTLPLREIYRGVIPPARPRGA